MAGQLPRDFMPVEWLESDRRWLHDVFAQYSGQKLRRILDNAVIYTNQWAVQQKAPDAVRACGFAAGVTYLLSTIDEHLPQVTAQRDTSDQPVEYGDTDLIEQYSP